MKAVVDRIVQYANRYKLTNAETGEVLGTFDFDEVTGTVQQVGTEIDKELFDSIAADLAETASSILAVASSILAVDEKTDAHIANTDNPHEVTKTQVGLGNVDNTSDVNKPVSTAQAIAIADAKKAGTDAQKIADAHIERTDNPHSVTKEQVGLGNVNNTSDIDKPVSTATQSAIDTETLARQNADKILQGNIDTETSERTAADENLQNQIDELDNAAKSLNAVKYTEQTLTEEQKAQARNNIDAASTTGNYPNMAVGTAVNAASAYDATHDSEGNVIADTYAKKTGTYSGMTVGTATKATQDGNGDNIADTYVDKASEQVITGRKIFYGDVTLLNVKYETQESGDTFSYAPVAFYDNADKKLGAVQGQKTGNGTVQAEIDVYDKDGNYAASMGLKWDHSTQNVFPFAPSGQDVVPNGDSSDKIICSEFLQGATIYYNINTSIGILGYRNKGYNISFDSNFTTSNGGYINVTRSGNVITISGWLRNRFTLYNGTAYVLLRNLPTAVADSTGVAPYASLSGVCRAYIDAGGDTLNFTPNFLVDTSTIAANSWFSISLTYITNE